MMFCPKCKSILLPKPGKGLQCSCGHKQEGVVTLKEHAKIKTAKVEVIEKEININPIVEMDCPKCMHKHAQFFEVQTRAADEPATKFYKCQGCGHTWRDYK
ncbi:MAG: transcription factor S [Candidatus Aenigmarchaeota archaeon]|nr:transcription factor S [Candidatus Aenigmarchaeota archaeon]